jgi:hypothetical protein
MFYKHMAVTEEIPSDYRGISSGGFKNIFVERHKFLITRISTALDRRVSPHLHVMRDWSKRFDWVGMIQSIRRKHRKAK